MEKRKQKNEDNDLTSSSKDRVSELPHPILHHILSFLPQNKAAQTCLLSKSWCNVWCTRLNIEFHEPGYVHNREAFLSIINQTLERYHRQNLSIKQFVVKMSSRVDSELISLLEKWIPIVLMNLGVETFHLTFPHSRPSIYYALPSAPVVFGAEFLTELYLSGVRISSFTDDTQQLCLKHLKTLSLDNVYIEDEAFAKIMASCPLLENVDLDHCCGLTTVDVNNLRHFVCVYSGCNIKFNHPSSLETIKITFCCNIFRPYNSNNHHFLRLKSLYLCSVELHKEYSFSCNYPCLEYLELRRCSGLTDVEVLSCSIKRLIIMDVLNQIKTITIDAPHILYFEFSSTYSLPSVSFARVAASREWESSISMLFDPSNIDDIKLNEILKALRQSRITLNLDYIGYQHVEDITYAGWYEQPLVVEHLNLRGFDSYQYDIAALFNCLFRIFHPRYMYTRMRPNPYLEIDKLAQFIWKTNLLRDVEFSRCYFWQQQLKELTVEISDHDPGQWLLVDHDPRQCQCRLLQGSCLTLCALEEIQETKNIRFGFQWRE